MGESSRETIIKGTQAKLGERSFPTLKDYEGQIFLVFLRSKNSYKCENANCLFEILHGI